MRRHVIIPIFFLLLFLVSLSGCQTNNEKTFTINQVTIHANVLSDGMMRVEELYDYTFDGSFHGTTRTINSKVTDFKAYLVPKGIKEPFNVISAKPLKVEKNDNTYKIYTKSVNEAKRVLYTYTVPQVVTKYQDAAFIHYSFFDHNNETDLHHLSINYHFPTRLTNQTKGFLHDYTRKAKWVKGAYGYTYNIKVLPAGQTTQADFLLTPSLFPNKQIDVYKTNYHELNNKELAIQDKLVHRQDRLAASKLPLMSVMLTIWLLVFIFAIIRIQRGSRDVEMDESYLAQLDPLYSLYLEQRLYFTNDALAAGLLSLVKKHAVKIEKAPIATKYQVDAAFPNETLQFTLICDQEELSPAEQYFISWLFTSTYQGKPSFTLDSIYGPTKEEKKDQKIMKTYQSQVVAFKKKFNTWKKMLKQENLFDRSHYKSPVPYFSLITILLAIGVGVVINRLYLIDAMSSRALIGLNITLVSMLFIGFTVFSMSPRWKLGLYLYFTSAVISTVFLHNSEPKLLVVFLTLGVLSLFSITPSERWHSEKRVERSMIIGWKRSIKKQQARQTLAREYLEQLLYLAVALRVTKPFITMYQGDDQFKQLEKTSPLLQDSSLETNSFHPGLFVYGYAASSAGGVGGAGGGGGAGAF